MHKEDRLKQLHKVFENQDRYLQSWQTVSESLPSNTRLVNCQVWSKAEDGSTMIEFGVPLRYIEGHNCWYTNHYNIYNGWVTYWRDFK